MGNKKTSKETVPASVQALAMVEEIKSLVQQGNGSSAVASLEKLKQMIEEKLSFKDKHGEHILGSPDLLVDSLDILRDLKKHMRTDLVGGHGYIIDRTEDVMHKAEALGIVPQDLDEEIADLKGMVKALAKVPGATKELNKAIKKLRNLGIEAVENDGKFLFKWV